MSIRDGNCSTEQRETEIQLEVQRLSRACEEVRDEAQRVTIRSSSVLRPEPPSCAEDCKVEQSNATELGQMLAGIRYTVEAATSILRNTHDRLEV